MNDMEITFFLEDVNNIQTLCDNMTEKEVFNHGVSLVTKNQSYQDINAVKHILKTVHKQKMMNVSQKYKICEFLYYEGKLSLDKITSFNENRQEVY